MLLAPMLRLDGHSPEGQSRGDDKQDPGRRTSRPVRPPSYSGERLGRPV